LISLRTGRLNLRPVNAVDIPDLIRIKADPLVFGQMLGGVRSPWQVTAELAEDIATWGRFGAGMFAIHERTTFHGITGLHERPDGRGLSLRFAVWPDTRGRGIAREAASAALRHAHDRIGIPRIIAVAREDNFASRMILGAIGMREHNAFLRNGHVMLIYESRALAAP